MKGKMMTAAICAFLVVALGSGLAFGRGRGGRRLPGRLMAAAFMGAEEVCVTAGRPRSAGLHRLAQPTLTGAMAAAMEVEGPLKGCTGASSHTVPARVPTHTARGGTVDYGAAGAAGRGPGGAAAGRGVYGVSGTTAGGRSYADVGRAGAAVGPGGNAVAGRSNVGGCLGAAGDRC